MCENYIADYKIFQKHPLNSRIFPAAISNLGFLWISRSCEHPLVVFSALTLLVGWQEGHLACKKTDWWGDGVVICLERGADMHMAQLMPMPLTVSRFIKIQIGFSCLVSAHPGSPRQRAIRRLCVCKHPDLTALTLTRSSRSGCGMRSPRTCVTTGPSWPATTTVSPSEI